MILARLLLTLLETKYCVCIIFALNALSHHVHETTQESRTSKVMLRSVRSSACCKVFVDPVAGEVKALICVCFV